MKRLIYLLLALFTIILWGISLPVITILLGKGFSPNLITFLRFALAAFVMFIAFRRKLSPMIVSSDRKYFYFMGLGGITLFFLFENTALKYTSVSNTALITATIPLFTLLAAAMFYRKKILWQNMIGIPLGLAGTALLFIEDLQRSGIHIKGDLLVIGSVFMWILYSFSYRKIMDKYSPITVVYKTFLYGSLFALPLLILDIGTFSEITVDLKSVSAILYLALLCSALGYFLWTLSLKNVGVKTTSNLILLLPVVSVSVSVLFLSEQLTLKLVVAGIAIIFSSWLTSISHKENYF